MLVDGCGGADSLSGGEGDDMFIGDLRCFFDFRLEGENDAFDGGAGFDVVSYFFSLYPVQADLAAGTATGEGADTLAGAEGDDRLDGGDRSDTLDGGPCTDNCVNGEARTNCETSTLFEWHEGVMVRLAAAMRVPWPSDG